MSPARWSRTISPASRLPAEPFGGREEQGLRAQRLARPGPIDQSPLHQEDLPVPDPGPGGAPLPVRPCPVCHTDLHLGEGDLPPPQLPLTPGHQVVAEVVAAGEATRLLTGARVGVPWL